MLRYYLKKSILSFAFLGCVILLVLIMVIGCFPSDLVMARDNIMPVLYCFIVTNSIGISHVLVPVITTVPFLFYYVEEIDVGTTYFHMMRGGITSTCFGRICAAIISSLGVTVLATAIFTVVCIVFGAGGAPNDSIVHFFKGFYYEKAVQSSTWYVYIIYVVAFCLYSMPWVLIGMLVSLFVQNKYLIFASPFIVFIAMSYISDFFGIFLLNPGSTLLKGAIRSLDGGGIYHNITYNVSAVLILGILYWIILKRKIRNEGL